MPETLPEAPAVAAPVATEAPAICASCGAVRLGPFCHACGEKKLDRHDYAFFHYAEHAVDTFTHLDVKVFKSIWSLVARPGAMAADLLAGRRVRWAKPFQTFLIANLIFYLVSTWLKVSFFDAGLYTQINNPFRWMVQPLAAAKAEALGLTLETYTEPYNHLSHTLSKTLIVLLVPVLAGILALLFWKQKRYFLEHVTVAALALSQFMLVSLIGLGAAYLGSRLLGMGEVGDSITVPSILVFNTAAFILAFRRIYPGKTVLMVVKGEAFSFLVMVSIIMIFRPLLFLITNAFT